MGKTMTRKLGWTEAAARMLEGEVLVDKQGRRWKYNQGVYACEINAFGWVFGKCPSKCGPFTTKNVVSRYEKTLFLCEKPKKDGENLYLQNFLFGQNTKHWTDVPNMKYPYKVKITIEEEK